MHRTLLFSTCLGLLLACGTSSVNANVNPFLPHTAKRKVHKKNAHHGAARHSRPERRVSPTDLPLPPGLPAVTSANVTGAGQPLPLPPSPSAPVPASIGSCKIVIAAKQPFDVAASGAVLTVPVRYIGPAKCTKAASPDQSDWVEILTLSDTGLQLKVDANASPAPRTATVTVVSSNPDEATRIVIQQKGLSTQDTGASTAVLKRAGT